MKKIQFTIKGNQEDYEGNPLPYIRVVGRALWLPSAKKYHAWKGYVRKSFYAGYPEYVMCDGQRILLDEQPLTTKPSETARMDIKLYWMNGVHGDPDNIFKGIADALFKNDKFLDGSFESRHAPDGKGRVDVTITVGNE
jgi:Holliday junction resolvase RusA-like endonuclease